MGRRLSVLVLHLQTSQVHYSLDEDGVIADVGVLRVELREWAEERTAAGDVHVADGPLKGRGGNVGPEGVNDMLAVVLVQEHEGHLGSKRTTGKIQGLRIRNILELLPSSNRAITHKQHLLPTNQGIRLVRKRWVV